MKKIFTVLVLFLAANAAFSQAQRLILFEEFTGENCAPCAFTNPYMQQLINTYPNDVLWLRYQCPIPTAGLIYYQDRTDVDPRLSYYGVNSAPWGQQDGAMWDSSIVSNWGNLPITWCADTNTLATNPVYLLAEHAVTSPFSVAVSYHLSTAADSFYAVVTVTGAQSYKVSTTGKLKLRTALIENLSFNIAPGSNGETDFPDVVRKMYPSVTGTAMPDSSYNGLVQTFNFSGKLPAYIYDKTQLRFAAFIQDDNNKHVQQAGVSTYDTLALDTKAQAIQGTYLTCDTPYLATFNFTNNGSQTLTSAVIAITLDGVSHGTVNWTGSLAPGAVATVNVPALDASAGYAHTIKAIVSQPNGTTDYNLGNDTASSNFGVALAAQNLPLVQGFETTPNPGWIVQNLSAGAYTWARATVGDSSSHSYFMDFYDASYGAINNLYTPTLDFTGVTTPQLTFSHANAQYDFGAGNGGLSQDSLYVLVSTDCGVTWATVYANGGNNLATVASDQNPYNSPAQADWVNDVVDLSSVANVAGVIIQFSAVSGNGNDLYLDNINILNPAAVGIKSVSSINSLSVFPNPTADLLNVRLELTQAADVSFNVTNALGQVVMNGPAETENAGNNALTINTAKLPGGVYFLSLINGTEKTSKMFAVIH